MAVEKCKNLTKVDELWLIQNDDLDRLQVKWWQEKKETLALAILFL